MMSYILGKHHKQKHKSGTLGSLNMLMFEYVDTAINVKHSRPITWFHTVGIEFAVVTVVLQKLQATKFISISRTC